MRRVGRHGEVPGGDIEGKISREEKAERQKSVKGSVERKPHFAVKRVTMARCMIGNVY
jgi:hypothetical protein